MSLHIERMEKELADLKDKYEKGTKFLEKEKAVPEYTDEVQRALLESQMKSYKEAIGTLRARIDYDKTKAGVKL